MLFAPVAILLALASGAAAALNKPVLDPGLPAAKFQTEILKVLPPTGEHHDTWGKGWLPVACAAYARNEKLNLNNVEAFNIYYNDLGMRDEVRHILIMWADSPNGYSYGDSIVIKGNFDFGTLGHEMGHNIDRGYGPNANAYPPQPYSNTPAWLNEYNKDSHIPDRYGGTNNQENWASIVGIALYDNVVPGGIGGLLIPDQWKQIFHQYATAQAKLGNAIRRGGYCKRRWNNDAPVSTTKRSRIEPDPRAEKRSVVQRYYGENGVVLRSEMLRSVM